MLGMTVVSRCRVMFLYLTVPPAPVIQVKALDTSSIQVSWTVYTGPEEITGYTLSCRRTGATHPETQILDHPLSHYIITGLGNVAKRLLWGHFV